MRQKKVFAALIAAIILLSAFAALANFGQKEGAKPLFQVDNLLIKVLVKSGENYSGSLKITNLGGGAGFSVSAAGVGNLLEFSENGFYLSSGQPKLLLFDISSGGAQPGVYVGKIEVSREGEKKDVPAIIEIQTREVLFAPNLNVAPQNRVVSQGSDNTIEVRLFNLKDREMNRVLLDYSLSDLDGNAIITETESAVVSTQASFYKTLHIPEDVKPGQYVFSVRARYGDSVGTSSYLFSVIPLKEAELPASYRDIAIAGAAILAVIVLALFFMQPRGPIMKEYEEEMKAHRKAALAKRDEIGETRRRLEEEYRKRLAEELQKHGRKKADIAENIKEAESDLKEHRKTAGKPVMQKFSEFMKQREKAKEEKKESEAEEKRRIEAERERIRKQKEQQKKILEERKMEQKKMQERQRIEEQKKREEERKLQEAAEAERRKRKAELRKKRMEALKRKMRHEAFRFLHGVGLVKTKKEKLEEEKRKKEEAEHKLRLAQRREEELRKAEAEREQRRKAEEEERKRAALEKKMEEEAERKRILAKIKGLEALEKRKEREFAERKKQLELAEKRHRKYELARESGIKSDTEHQKEIAKSEEAEKREGEIRGKNKIAENLKAGLQKLRERERQARLEEKAAIEAIGKEYKNHLREMEEKRLLADSEMKKKEERLKAKYASLQKHFAKAEKARKAEEKLQKEGLKEDERRQRERLEHAEKERRERLDAEQKRIEEENRKRQELIREKERRERERLGRERRAEAEQEAKTRRLQRRRFVRKIEMKISRLIKRIEHDSFNILHSFGLVHTAEERKRIMLIKEKETKERELLERKKIAEKERIRRIAEKQEEEKAQAMETEKKRKAEIATEENRRAEGLKKIVAQRNILAKKGEEEKRRELKARIRKERESAAARRAALIREKESLAKKRESEYNGLKKSLKARREEIAKNIWMMRQKIRESEKRLVMKEEKISAEEKQKEKALIEECRKNLASQKILERKHFEEEEKARQELSEQKAEIRRLKLDSLLLRLGLKGVSKKKNGETKNKNKE